MAERLQVRIHARTRQLTDDLDHVNGLEEIRPVSEGPEDQDEKNVDTKPDEKEPVFTGLEFRFR